MHWPLRQPSPTSHVSVQEIPFEALGSNQWRIVVLEGWEDELTRAAFVKSPGDLGRLLLQVEVFQRDLHELTERPAHRELTGSGALLDVVREHLPEVALGRSLRIAHRGHTPRSAVVVAEATQCADPSIAPR